MFVGNTLAYRRGALAMLLFAAVAANFAHAQRQTILMNGVWQIADSVSAEEIPVTFTHTVPVPGLAHSAKPPFPDVDRYDSGLLLHNLVDQGMAPKSILAELGDKKGISRQPRNYFWYSRTFAAPARRSVALLKFNKAQFGIAVYLNGQKLGEHFPCFTAAYFDASNVIRWGTSNVLVVRVGAHPGVLPKSVSGGTDFEKNSWTPGIYDDVSLLVMDNPVIATIQVAPRIAESAVVVETEIRNYGPARSTVLQQRIREWKSGSPIFDASPLTVNLVAGETKKIRQTVIVPHAHLWSPEDPFLYVLESRTAGDSTTTRFGMREFRFDTPTQRAYLNGKPYFLRGSNIALHRFFEDSESATLPWDSTWVHRLLVDIPKQMHWNSFRFCIGPVPDHWLEVADEAGLLVQNEYMVWVDSTQGKSMFPAKAYDSQEMIGEFQEWMRDNWNHPSVAIWDANNESLVPEFGKTVIPAVRDLDLSHRPWENSYNPPVGPDDPMESHSYLFYDTATSGEWKFRMTDLEAMAGFAPSSSDSKSGHAMILNEYGWLWLNRDGSPTLLTNKLYALLAGPNSTNEERFAMNAYLLAGETEFWRAYRRYAGVLHFVYLTSSGPKSFTSDNFSDVKTLSLESHFADYMRQAFKPLGVYIDFWQPELSAGRDHDFMVMMINDKDEEQAGVLQMTFVRADGSEATRTETPFCLSALGAQSYSVTLSVPREPGKYTLKAMATESRDSADPTISRRWVTLKEAQAVGPQP